MSIILTSKTCSKCEHTYTDPVDISLFTYQVCKPCYRLRRKLYNARRRKDPVYIEYNRDVNKIFQRNKYDRERTEMGRTIKHKVTNFDIQSVKIADYRGDSSWGLGLTELFST